MSLDEISLVTTTPAGPDSQYALGLSQGALGELTLEVDVKLGCQDTVSELTIKVADPDSTLLLGPKGGWFPLDSMVTWTPEGGKMQRFLVVERGRSGQFETQITCRAWATETMRRIYGPLPNESTPMEPDTLPGSIRQLMPKGGYVSLTAEPVVTVPTMRSVEAGAGETKPENLFTAIERWASEEMIVETYGSFCTEAGATGEMYFGKMSWFVKTRERITIVKGESDDIVEIVSARETLDADGQSLSAVLAPRPVREFRVKVSQRLGKRIVPTMVVEIKGWGVLDADDYWVTEVTGQLDGISDWEIAFRTPPPDKVLDQDFGVYDGEMPLNPGALMGGVVSKIVTGSGATGKSGRKILTPSEIISVLITAGWPTDLLYDAVRCVLGESGGDPGAVSPVGARGLWQIMPPPTHNVTDKCAYDPVCASGAALTIYRNALKFGGPPAGWWPWDAMTYKGNNRANLYNGEARKAVQDYLGNKTTMTPTVSTPTVQGPGVPAMIAIAKKEAASNYSEGPNNQNKYAPEVGHANNQKWCATFVVWCALKAGVRLPDRSASTDTHRKAFKDAGLLQPRDMKAQPGDLIFYDFDGGWTEISTDVSHVGIVLADDGHTVTAVEGNTQGGAVSIRTRTRPGKIVCFGRVR